MRATQSGLSSHSAPSHFTSAHELHEQGEYEQEQYQKEQDDDAQSQPSDEDYTEEYKSAYSLRKQAIVNWMAFNPGRVFLMGFVTCSCIVPVTMDPLFPFGVGLVAFAASSQAHGRKREPLQLFTFGLMAGAAATAWTLDFTPAFISGTVLAVAMAKSMLEKRSEPAGRGDWDRNY